MNRFSYPTRTLTAGRRGCQDPMLRLLDRVVHAFGRYGSRSWVAAAAGSGRREVAVRAPEGTKSIRDVAAEAGVSVGTVSNVLNRPELVAPATRARVEQAIAALGFVRNESARQLRAGRSRTLGLLVLDVSNPFVNDVYGGELAVTHLVERGHRRIAFVGGPFSIKQVHDRHDGARRALLAAGLPPSGLTAVETPALNFSSGLAAGARIAEIAPGQRPTAAFCANDLLALGLLQEMTRRQLRVPGDHAIVGYDDIDFAAAAAVPLSSVRQPRDQLGRAAAELLIEEAAEGTRHGHRQIVFEPQLVVRDSSDHEPRA